MRNEDDFNGAVYSKSRVGMKQENMVVHVLQITGISGSLRWSVNWVDQTSGCLPAANMEEVWAYDFPLYSCTACISQKENRPKIQFCRSSCIYTGNARRYEFKSNYAHAHESGISDCGSLNDLPLLRPILFVR